jgi:hypothetical protein
MLNQLTIRDYEKRIEKFDFADLVAKESASDIAKAIFNKVKNNPMMSEFFVKVVLSNIK